jgi:hypothetical protein
MDWRKINKNPIVTQKFENSRCYGLLYSAKMSSSLSFPDTKGKPSLISVSFIV